MPTFSEDDHSPAARRSARRVHSARRRDRRGVARRRATSPTASHACGCRVSPDRRRGAESSCPSPRRAALVAAVRATRAIAAVFSEPATDRTIQLKGFDAAVEPVTAAGRGRPAGLRGRDGRADGAVRLFRRVRARRVALRAGASWSRVTFTPSAAFVQTPGPRAGRAARALNAARSPSTRFAIASTARCRASSRPATSTARRTSRICRR